MVQKNKKKKKNTFLIGSEIGSSFIQFFFVDNCERVKDLW